MYIHTRVHIYIDVYVCALRMCERVSEPIGLMKLINNKDTNIAITRSVMNSEAYDR